MTLAEKLAAARVQAAAGPVESRGILRLSGKGGRDFLHRMSTQHLSALPADGSAYAAFLDGRGHIVGEGLVVARPDDLLFVTEAGGGGHPAAAPAQVPAHAPVKIDDASPSLGAMAVLGPKGIGLAREAAAGA